MHPYATDSSERRFVPFLLAVLGILAAWGLGWIVKTIQMAVPWWLDTPAVMGFYGLFYKLFDSWLWQTSILRSLKLVKVPNLNGVWSGTVSSSFNEYAVKHDATITIHQTWTQISIRLQSGASESHSLSGMILAETLSSKLINYEYRNEPKPHALNTMHAHRGAGRVTLSESNGIDVLEGEYFTGRDRQTVGRMYFERKRT